MTTINCRKDVVDQEFTAVLMRSSWWLMLSSTCLRISLFLSVVGFNVVMNSLLDVSSFSNRSSSTCAWKAVRVYFYFVSTMQLRFCLTDVDSCAFLV